MKSSGGADVPPPRQATVWTAQLCISKQVILIQKCDISQHISGYSLLIVTMPCCCVINTGYRKKYCHFFPTTEMKIF